jgi:NTE family protein
MTDQGMTANKEREKCCDLVFEGGGVKGIALVGALSVLEEQGFHPQNVAGTSAGAIVATLLAAGYTCAELRDIIMKLPFHRFKDKAWEDRIPLLGRSLSLLKDQGIYEGNFFLEYIRDLLEAKQVRTFRDLIHPDYANSDDLRYRYRVQVVVSDITERRLLVLPKDADKLGINPDDLDVAQAVRMSMSIPVFFEPVRFTNPKTGVEHLLVDGGMLSNFPVWLFDCYEGEPEWATFGLMLVEDPDRTLGEAISPPPRRRRSRVLTVIDYLKSLVETMMAAHDRMYIEEANFARTINIPTLGVRATDFDLSQDRAMELFETGRTATQEFLEVWDFQAYIDEYRRGKKHSRRQEIANEMQRAIEG